MPRALLGLLLLACSGLPPQPHPAPRPERALVTLSPARLASALDSVLARALRSPNPPPVFLAAHYGGDGSYEAGKGLHDEAWLRSLLGRGWLPCMDSLPGARPCPAGGSRTLIALTLPRLSLAGDTVVHVSVYTFNPDVRDCGWGCYFGETYDMRLRWEQGTWSVSPQEREYIN